MNTTGNLGQAVNYLTSQDVDRKATELEQISQTNEMNLSVTYNLLNELEFLSNKLFNNKKDEIKGKAIEVGNEPKSIVETLIEQSNEQRNLNNKLQGIIFHLNNVI